MASLTIVSLFVVRIEELFVQEGEEEEGEVGGTGAELRETRNDLVWLEGVVGSVGSGWWVGESSVGLNLYCTLKQSSEEGKDEKRTTN